MSTYAIDRRHDAYHDHDVWRVWELIPDEAPVLLGEYDTLSSAKASLRVAWSPPDRPEHGDWNYIGVPLPEDEDLEYAREQGGPR